MWLLELKCTAQAFAFFFVRTSQHRYECLTCMHYSKILHTDKKHRMLCPHISWSRKIITSNPNSRQHILFSSYHIVCKRIQQTGHICENANVTTAAIVETPHFDVALCACLRIQNCKSENKCVNVLVCWWRHVRPSRHDTQYNQHRHTNTNTNTRRPHIFHLHFRSLSAFATRTGIERIPVPNILSRTRSIQSRETREQIDVKVARCLSAVHSAENDVRTIPDTHPRGHEKLYVIRANINYEYNL